VQTNARTMVQLFEQAACPALRPFIQRFLVVKFPSFHRDAHLADTRPVAAFSFQGRCRIDGDQWAAPAAFTGLRQTLRVHEHCHEHAVLLATFTAVGATAFLRPSRARELRHHFSRCVANHRTPLSGGARSERGRPGGRVASGPPLWGQC
jgi:hypothetical protein